jgi:hypothetical protein
MYSKARGTCNHGFEWRRQMRCIMARPPPCRPILVQWRARARAMRARIAVVVVGGGGKVAIIAAAINRRHSLRRCHWCRWLNPTTATNDNDRYRRCRQPPLPLPHSRRRQPSEASGRCSLLTAAMAVRCRTVEGERQRWS